MIYKLIEHNKADWIIKRLPKIWIKLNWLRNQLLDPTREFSTMDLIIEKNGFNNFYTTINDFNNNYGAWFNTNYPLYASALAGAITGLNNINTIIMNGLQANYWDAVTNKPIVADITLTHRTALANAIYNELEP